MSMRCPWPPGAATAVGSMPGDDIREALRIVFDELPELPHLPELPVRGPGMDAVGRSAALLAELYVDLQPSGWRLVDRPGRDLRRAVDGLLRDLDGLEEVAAGYRGPLKIQACGPWTLAAALELRRGDRAVSDLGATRDLVQSLGEGLRGHVDAVRSRVPGAEVVLQIDEPALPAVLAGTLPTASGYGTLRAVEESLVETWLGEVLAAVDVVPVVHCCAARVPLGLLRRAGASAVSLDAGLLRERDDEELGTAVAAGTSLWLGLVSATEVPGQLDPGRLAEPVRALWRRLGFDPARLTHQVVVTPACGLAGTVRGYPRTALRLARQTARALAESPG